mmetsp:Transcript_69824/g.163914  ORF Transcript_69824/g.163914 Transcript_69824/m.163914 type:complete len:204 (+) Transcript_69824:527-1138(+)
MPNTQVVIWRLSRLWPLLQEWDLLSCARPCDLSPGGFLNGVVRGLQERILWLVFLQIFQRAPLRNVPLDQLLHLDLALNLLSIRFCLQFPPFHLGQHLFLPHGGPQPFLPHHPNIIKPRLHQPTNQFVFSEIGHSSSLDLSLVALPDAFPNGNPLQHLFQLGGLLLLPFDKFLMRCLGWVLLQGMEVRRTCQRKHVADCHGHQ